MKPFNCTICPSAFATTGTLARHMITHSKSNNLKRHKVSIRSQIKKSCGLCRQTFGLSDAEIRRRSEHIKSHLNRHFAKLNAKDHDNLVPYIIWKAEKLKNLAAKMKIKNGGGKFQKCGTPSCEVCPNVLERRSPLIESNG